VRLRNLSLRDKAVFARHLSQERHELSVYAFANIYIWKALFCIQWAVIEDSLCVFFKDKIGCFLYLAPLGKKNPEVIKKAFAITDSFNKNKEISRIENVEEKDVPFYRNLGLWCKEKSCDYLCERSDLAKLQGDKFKSKRACYNYFVKHYDFEYLPFSLKYGDDCLKLYNRWMRERKNADPIYQGMLADSKRCLGTGLPDYKGLDLVGRIVKVDNKIKGFTFGYKLNSNTFCILYEITDLSIKGLAQFIFREFCRELKDYKYINIMDDSGLENLKKVKLSYRPLKLIPAYIASRKN